jgi:hypothetical protein
MKIFKIAVVITVSFHTHIYSSDTQPSSLGKLYEADGRLSNALYSLYIRWLPTHSVTKGNIQTVKIIVTYKIEHPVLKVEKTDNKGKEQALIESNDCQITVKKEKNEYLAEVKYNRNKKAVRARIKDMNLVRSLFAETTNSIDKLVVNPSDDEQWSLFYNAKLATYISAIQWEDEDGRVTYLTLLPQSPAPQQQQPVTPPVVHDTNITEISAPNIQTSEAISTSEIGEAANVPQVEDLSKTMLVHNPANTMPEKSKESIIARSIGYLKNIIFRPSRNSQEKSVTLAPATASEWPTPWNSPQKVERQPPPGGIQKIAEPSEYSFEMKPAASSTFEAKAESNIVRGKLEYQHSVAELEIVANLYSYVITIVNKQDQSFTIEVKSPYSLLKNTAKTEKSTDTKVVTASISLAVQEFRTVEKQYKQLKPALSSANDNEAYLKIKRGQDHLSDVELQKIILHNTIIDMINRGKQTLTFEIGDEPTTIEEPGKYRLSLCPVFEGPEKLAFYKDMAKRKNKTPRFTSFFGLFFSNVGPGWLPQVNKLAEKNVSNHTYKLGGKIYLLSRQFNDTSSAHDDNHYEIYIMVSDEHLVDLFYEITNTLSSPKFIQNNGVCFVVIRLTPGASKAIDDHLILPRIIIGMDPKATQGQTEKILTALEAIIKNGHFKGIKDKPRYSQQVFSDSFVYAAQGDSNKKASSTQYRLNYRINEAYKNEDNALVQPAKEGIIASTVRSLKTISDSSKTLATTTQKAVAGVGGTRQWVTSTIHALWSYLKQ